MTRPSLRSLPILAVPLAVLAVFLVASTQVNAGAITNTNSSVKIGVFQGVIGITPPTSDSTAAMEIGNSGRDIAASGDIYLLPGGHAYPNGLRIYTPAPAAAFPQASPVLDNFNRANGAPGANWQDNTANFAILSTTQLGPGGTGTYYLEWVPTVFGSNQQAYVTFNTVSTTGVEQSLLLKTQGATWNTGSIKVSYVYGTSQVVVKTYLSPTWTTAGTISGVTFAALDVFGAEALSNGTVNVYKNSVLVGTVSVATWPFASFGGRIGLSVSNSSTTRFDNFGGGNYAYQPAALDVGYGRVCLNTNGGAAGSEAWQCVSSWSATPSEPLWTDVSGVLAPDQSAPAGGPLDVIYLGTPAVPIPASFGRGLEIVSNYNGVVMTSNGQLVTGYLDSNAVYHGGKIEISGNLRIGYTAGPSAISLYGLAGAMPWSQLNKYDPSTGIPSGIDADTFDGVAVAGVTTLPFAADRNLFWKESPAGHGSVLCLAATDTFLCTGGTNAGTPCPVGNECLGGGTCTRMCRGTTTTCADDPVATNNPAPPAVPASLFCANAHLRNTWFCVGGSAPAGVGGQGSVLCNRDADCAQYGAAVCQQATCTNYCNQPTVGQPGYGVICSSDATCSALQAGLTCGSSNCSGHGACRANGSSPIPNGFVGSCLNTVSCTKDSDCNVAGEAGLCQGFGYCSQGSDFQAADVGQKHCVGGTRDTKVCDKTSICIGGTQDSKTTTPATCTGGGGVIGNSVDYCPSGACLPDVISNSVRSYCNTSDDCSGAGNEYCVRGSPTTGAPSIGKCSPATCASACAAQVVNRCRGKTDVFGTNLNVCSAHGTDTTYNVGTSILVKNANPVGQCGCDCTASGLKYSVSGTTANFDLCTPVLQ